MEYVKIKEFAEVVSGSTPKTNRGEYWDGQYPWITPAEINSDTRYVYDTQRKLTDLGVKSSSLKLLKKNTVLLTSRAPIGKVAIAGVDLYCNQGFKNLICNEEVACPKYLYYWLSSKTAYLNSLGRGATFKEISKSIVEEIEIPILPIEKQTKVADVLDKAQELIDKRKEQIAACEELIKSLFYHMFGDPVTNSKKWKKRNIGSRFVVKTGATPLRDEKEYWEKGSIPWIKTAELTGALILESEECITHLGCRNSSVSFLPKETILIAMYGQGKTRGMTGKLGIEATTNQACAALLPNSLDNQDFVWSQLKLTYNDLRNLGRGGNQPNLNLNLVKGFEIIVPPIDLQNDFAQKVEKIEQQKQRLQQSLTELENNFNALMQRAFKGELF